MALYIFKCPFCVFSELVDLKNERKVLTTQAELVAWLLAQSLIKQISKGMKLKKYCLSKLLYIA